MKNWQNLKENKCPFCSHELKVEGLLETTFRCSHCDFSISQGRFDEIISDMYKPKQRRCAFGENLSELNNLGREKVSEDFSDSPFYKQG